MKYVDVIVDNNTDATDRFYTYKCPFDEVKPGASVMLPFSVHNKLTQAYGEVPAVIFSTIYNEENEEVTVFALNTNKNESSETQIDLSSFGKTQMIMRTELSGKNLGAKNSLENPDAIKTVEISPVQSDNNIYDVNLNAASWNVLRFKISK